MLDKVCFTYLQGNCMGTSLYIFTQSAVSDDALWLRISLGAAGQTDTLGISKQITLYGDYNVIATVRC